MQKSLKIILVFVLLSCLAASALGNTIVYGIEKTDAPFRWRTRTIHIAVSGSLLQTSNIKDDSDVLGAVRRSLEAWGEAADIDLQETTTDKRNVSPAGNAGDGVSLITVAPTAENALLFAGNAEDVAATTRVFFDRKGFITEADIVLNPYQQFSTDGTFGTFDLESTLTHEIGHLLGLDHSPMLGSTMHENYGKNGIYGMQNFAPRTLAELDRNLIRAKYGAPGDDGKCCGVVNGELLDPNGLPAKGVELWAEDAKTGKVHAELTTNSTGAFLFNGLPYGTYKLYSQKIRKPKNSIPSQEIGEVRIENDEAVTFTRRLSVRPDDIEVKYLGFNGQLTGLAVPVNAGKTYTIYLGGKNLNRNNISVHFNSPFLTIVPNSFASHDYGEDLSVVSFDLSAAPRTPIGEYSVFVNSVGGGRSVVIGGIAVRKFLNPLSNIILGDQ